MKDIKQNGYCSIIVADINLIFCCIVEKNAYSLTIIT